MTTVVTAPSVFSPAAEIPHRHAAAIWRDFYGLTKPTITLLVVITVFPSLLLASESGLPGLGVSLAALLGAGLCSASAAAMNQILERHVDQKMARTKVRSLACGRVSQRVAWTYALLLLLVGQTILWTWTTPLASLTALAGQLFYVFIYTLWLKPRTAQNIVIGGAAGAVGPLIGWAAITNTLPLAAWLQFLLIFFWTPPHFWALALKYKSDYAAARIPMYPVVYGDHSTRRAMLLYSLTLLPCVLASS